MADLDEPVHVVAAVPEWLDQGRELTRDVGRLVEPESAAAVVAHIGSTAVPGLDAKSIIDLQVGCRGSEVPAVVAALRRAGYDHLGTAGVPGREYLRRRDEPPINVHVVERDGSLWRDNILFRDYLTAHPAAADRYAAAKREAARRAPSLLAYSAAKAAVVADLMAAAHTHAANPCPSCHGGQ
ncbi:GrpB family protein [Streptomyces lonarensis]|uniref:GrpB family protein n=1 Tax=Streptomyces lonarensis TaxID=700599 RepID=A0A7X6D0W6_9ACTN|nr:GrpB family protein [Streptomyces lonarensis]NJQ06159.1 GrpB family protein [Streptomyces lonarensis]